MHHIREDCIKSRLTERAHLTLAVEKLMERGVPEELIPVHLARVFYVDMDELNAVLEKMRTMKEAGEKRPLRAVA
ncbi:hypothetical protein [Nitratireductor sp. GCM10026969]|uniref:hypothetical protein n=1 Tax=Nitratireductor sp. GCM10026969 TaxID=3252645 RepID=UPI00360A47E2